MLKKVFNERNITSFKEQLSLLHWRHVNFNKTYDTFLRKLLDTYDANFPFRKYILKDTKAKIIHQISKTKARVSYQRCSVRKGVLRNFAKLTGKHLCQSLFFDKVAETLLKKRLWHRCFLTEQLQKIRRLLL